MGWLRKEGHKIFLALEKFYYLVGEFFEDKMHEIIPGRLYCSKSSDFKPVHLSGVTVLVNVSGDRKLGSKMSGICLDWNMPDDVEEGEFYALVRFCASLMRCSGHSVLVVGSSDASDVISTCIIREYIGCTAMEALEIIRKDRPKCMTRSELIETVMNYKI